MKQIIYQTYATYKVAVVAMKNIMENEKDFTHQESASSSERQIWFREQSILHFSVFYMHATLYSPTIDTICSTERAFVYAIQKKWNRNN